MENCIKIPRMETIKNTAALFNLPVHFVRQKVNSGEIVAVRAGNRYLVNVDKFADYLNTCTAADPARRSDKESTAKIKPISIR